MLRITIFSLAMFAATAVLSTASAVEKGVDNLEHTSDSLEKVRELVAQEKAILVDVRSPIEWNDGHVAGAVFMPWRDLQDKFDEKYIREHLPEDKIIYTYCAVGYRSLRAGKIIAKHKYDVRPLKPGFDELVKAGFESEKK